MAKPRRRRAESHEEELVRRWGVRLEAERKYFYLSLAEPDGDYLAVVHYKDEEMVQIHVPLVDQQRVPLGPQEVPAKFWVLVETPNGSRFSLGLMIEQGKLICDQVIVKRGSEEQTVSTSALRRVQIDKFMRVVVERVWFPTDKAAYLFGLEVSAHVPRRGNRLEDEHFRRVAEVYRAALLAGQHPTQAVAKAMHTARSNAGRWVMEARRRGFLGEAEWGKAGEK